MRVRSCSMKTSREATGLLMHKATMARTMSVHGAIGLSSRLNQNVQEPFFWCDNSSSCSFAVCLPPSKGTSQGCTDNE
eukprot:3121174-Amphidinium_carterae.2